MNRRDFLKAAAAAGIVAGLPAASHAAASPAYKTKLEKALIAQVADDATCERIAKAGFPGVELTRKGITVEQAIEGRRTAEKHGLRIHSLMSGGADFNNPDPDARKRSFDVMVERIQVTAAYGASTMLLVPCRVGGMTMPKPSQFSIDFDPQTLHVRTVVKGDNAPFAAYIDAQNRSTDLTREAVTKLIPVAAREGVIIALENVWNNLWVTPEFAAAFVKSFDSPWVKAYVDLGNHVRYTATENWLRAMGNLIVKLHIKDFRIDRSMKNDGEFVGLGRGSVNWKSVRDVIDEVRYNGWVTIEENNYSDAEYSAIMDWFFAGQALTEGASS
jgi:hexulose-6-phosphate isomerase